MTLRVILTVLEIVALVAVLGYFLNVIARLLNSISTTLGKITFGVRAVLTQCSVIGPAVDRINANLQTTVNGLDQAAAGAERLAR